MSDERAPVVSMWCGQPRYACPFCAYDTTEQAKVDEHIALVHPVPAPPDDEPGKPAKAKKG